MATIAETGQIVGTESGIRLPVLRTLTKSRIGLTLLIAATTTLLGILFAIPMMSNGWRQPLTQWWAWGLLTPVIVAVDRKLPFSGKEFGRRAWAHLAASLLFTAIYLHVFMALRAIVHDVAWTQLEPSKMFSWGMLGWYTWSLLIYWMIVGALQAYRYYERYLSSELRLERMEKSYSQARLNALRMQLDPHFLFNALNTISSHVERDPRLTRRMIEHLGDLLRMSLESKDRQEVPLAEELAFLEHYLEIQRIRFGDQLLIEIDVAPEVRYASVPSLFLQPLVENAIRHGISRRISGGMVLVAAKAVDSRLEICVEDDGVGLPHAWTIENGSGLGLSVTRERLAGLYPDGQAQMQIRRRAEGGTAVEIRLPLVLMGDESDVA